jgi:hypothetical protein
MEAMRFVRVGERARPKKDPAGLHHLSRGAYLAHGTGRSPNLGLGGSLMRAEARIRDSGPVMTSGQLEGRPGRVRVAKANIHPTSRHWISRTGA